MDDQKPANESNDQGLNKIDLSQLQDFTFGTQWTEAKVSPQQRRDRDDRGGGERRDFRGGDDRGGQFERGPYVSPFFTMTCYPEDAGFAAMVKAVRASCRTFQLFEITKAVLEKNERFVIVVQRKAPERGAAAPAPASAEGTPALAP